jgi:hypothetical protein
MEEIEERIMLITPKQTDSLNGYLFLNEQHAIEWLSQEFVSKADYRVKVTKVKRTRCQCGNVFWKPTRAASKNGAIPVKEFLEGRRK